MHKRLLTLAAFVFLILSFSTPKNARASADRQSFAGLGVGFQVLAQNESGTGFYTQGFGGYAFNSLVAVGLHAGYSNVGNVGIRTFDFGAFLQLTDTNSGIYGKLYADGVNAAVSGGGVRNGVQGTQTGFAPGIGLGVLIPTAGDFHLVPELSYRLAFLNSSVNLIAGAFNLMWDF